VCSRNPVRRHVLPTNSAAVPVDNRKHGCGSSGLALERDWRLFTYRLDAGGMLTGTRDRPPFDCGLVVTRPLRLWPNEKTAFAHWLLLKMRNGSNTTTAETRE